jgi:hypothetical protein
LPARATCAARRRVIHHSRNSHIPFARPGGKRLPLRHLSPDCAELLLKAGGMIESNAAEYPHYHLADDRLG